MAHIRFSFTGLLHMHLCTQFSANLKSMSAYNHARYLPTTIHSVLNQSMPDLSSTMILANWRGNALPLYRQWAGGELGILFHDAVVGHLRNYFGNLALGVLQKAGR